MKRRQFFKTAGGAALLTGSGMSSLLMDLYAFSRQDNLSQVEARFYKKHPNREIECELCPRFCKLGDKERGYCGVRENIGGTYYTLVYGKACSANIDPIEKKPLFHYLPGSSALSIATAGCNVNCKFCQNWEISQVRPEQVTHYDFPPQAVVQSAQKNNCPVIAYTYTEPIIFYEYMYDTSREANKKGIHNAVITGGYINPEPLVELTKVVQAIKVDLKAFSQDFYTSYVRGKLEPILEAIKIISKSKVWMEIVYLVIPTLNDSAQEIRGVSQWLRKEVGPDVPPSFFPVSSHVSGEKPAFDSYLHSGASVQYRQRRRAQLRLYRQCPWTPGGKHLLSQMRKGGHRQKRLSNRKDRTGRE